MALIRISYDCHESSQSVQIFDDFLNIGIHAAFSLEDSESKIVPIDFFVGLKESLAMDVIAGHDVNQIASA